MSTTYNSDVYASKRSPKDPLLAGVTVNQKASAVLGSVTINDTVNMFSIPPNAVVTGITLQANGQMDSGTALTWDVGIAGTLQLFVAASAVVGRASGVTGVSGIATGGTLYKNTTGADLPLVVTAHAAPGTAVSGGTISLCGAYYVEKTPGTTA